MRHHGSIAGLLLLGSLLAAGSTVAATIPPRDAVAADTLITLDALLQTLDRQVEQNDIDGLRSTLRAIQADGKLHLQPVSTRAYVANAQIWLYLHDKAPAQALQAADEILLIAPDLPYAQISRIEALQMQGQSVQAAESLLALLPKVSEHASLYFSNWLVQQIGEGLAEHPALQRQLLQALFDVEWAPDETAPQEVWLALAILQADAGDWTQVSRIAEALHDPLLRLGLEVDRRFDPWRAQQAGSWDTRASAARWISRLRAALAPLPDKGSALSQLSTALLEAGDNTAVLALTERWAEADLEALDDEARSSILWMLNVRAVAQRRLGEIDAGFATLRRIAATPLYNQPNINQQLNLAVWHSDNQQPEQALALLDALAEVSNITGYGLSVRDAVVVGSQSQLGNTAAVDAALTSMRARQGVAREPLLDALLDVNDLDGAAAEYIARLQSPRLRNKALRAAQTFAGEATLPGAQRREQRFKQVLERADIQALLQQYGHRDRYPLYPVTSLY